MRSWVLRCVAVFALGVAVVSNVLAGTSRIDGTSEEAFDRSYTKLVRKLSQQEQRRLALALLSALLPEKCLSSDMVIALTFLPVSAEHRDGLRPCRAQLNGKSYQDLIEAADAKHGSSPPSAPPN